MVARIPRLVIAGLSGDSGKTIVSLAFLHALRQKGYKPAVFKKGPDYIDSAWLARAADHVCRNLDTYLVEQALVRDIFIRRAFQSDIAVIEGNRGLFDGKDVAGTHSSAELALLLQAPVVLVVNVAKATRTVAAVVSGCLSFDSRLKVAGVILNRVSGDRHGKIISESIEKYCRVPVLGRIPRLPDDCQLIPGRHLGLITPAEYTGGTNLDRQLLEIAGKHLDIDSLVGIASAAPPLEQPVVDHEERPLSPRVRIGYFCDPVFTFYYPENLEALEHHGAQLVPVNSLEDSELPDIDGLYIGGGFPETHAARLADNRSLQMSVKQGSKQGLPVYAECGGLIFLSDKLIVNDNVYPMSGVFRVELQLESKPVGHGYTSLRVDQHNPFFEIDTFLRGHEFHYTGIRHGTEELATCMNMQSGVGLGAGRDGLVSCRTLATYSHLHASGAPRWAAAFAARAREYRWQRHSDNSNEYGEPESERETLWSSLTGIKERTVTRDLRPARYVN